MDNSARCVGHRRTLAPVTFDVIDDFQQPRCPVDGVLMRDAPIGWECPACGRAEPQEMVELPISDVRGIHGG